MLLPVLFHKHTHTPHAHTHVRTHAEARGHFTGCVCAPPTKTSADYLWASPRTWPMSWRCATRRSWTAYGWKPRCAALLLLAHACLHTIVAHFCMRAHSCMYAQGKQPAVW